MKTLIATLGISAALLVPAATFAATTAEATAATSASVAVTTAPSHDKTKPSHAATNVNADKSFGKQASDDREGLARIVEQSRQLGATN